MWAWAYVLMGFYTTIRADRLTVNQICEFLDVKSNTNKLIRCPASTAVGIIRTFYRCSVPCGILSMMRMLLARSDCRDVQRPVLSYQIAESLAPPINSHQQSGDCRIPAGADPSTCSMTLRSRSWIRSLARHNRTFVIEVRLQ